MSDNLNITNENTTISVNELVENINVSEDSLEFKIFNNSETLQIEEKSEILNISDTQDVLHFGINDIIIVNNNGGGSNQPEPQTRLLDFISLDEVLIGYSLGTDTSLPIWRICRIEKSFLLEPDMDLADGSDQYNKIWDDRLTYTY